MTIELSFNVYDVKNEPPLRKEDYPGNIILYDTLLEGDLTFKIDQTDFSLEGVYIVNFMIGLYLCCRSCIADHGRFTFSALETPVAAYLEYIENNSAQLYYKYGRTTSSKVDLAGLFEKAKAGLIEALAALYSVYPQLLEDYSFHESLHIEQDLINEAILRSKA